MPDFIEHSEYHYRSIPITIPKSWLPKITPLIDFVIDNGGTVKRVRTGFFGLRFQYEAPHNHDEDLWDAFFEMVRLIENRSGNWK